MLRAMRTIDHPPRTCIFISLSASDVGLDALYASRKREHESTPVAAVRLCSLGQAGRDRGAHCAVSIHASVVGAE